MDRLVTVGLDLSLSCAAAVAWNGEQVLDSLRIRTKPSQLLEHRCDEISAGLLKFIKMHNPALTLIESGARGGKVVDLNIYHLAGVVRWRLWRREVLIHLVTPTTLKLYATDDGRAKKPAMLAAARELWPACPDHNVADAYWLARWGWRRYSSLVEDGD